jgi:hypothetical protein
MKYTSIIPKILKFFEIYSSMLDFGLNGLLSLILKGPFRVVLIEERRVLMSWISWDEIPSAEGVEPEGEDVVDLVLVEGEVLEGEVPEEEVSFLLYPVSGVEESFEVFSAGGVEGVPLGTSDFRACSSFFISDFASFLVSEFASFFSFTPLIKDLTPETVFPMELSS